MRWIAPRVDPQPVPGDNTTLYIWGTKCLIIFRSEGQAQVFIIVNRFLKRALANIAEDEYPNHALIYDNMCNLAGLKAAKARFPGYGKPLCSAFRKVRKYIDQLHLVNHVQASCKEYYDSAELLRDGIVRKLNTMAAEQTFSGLGRTKRIFCAMPKRRHMFLLHHIVERHNEYVIHCRNNNVDPNLPKPVPDYQRAAIPEHHDAGDDEYETSEDEDDCLPVPTSTSRLDM